MSDIDTVAAGDCPPPADAVPRNWVDRIAPRWAKPYLRLARADRPIGVWLLLLPCWWSAALAATAERAPLPDLWHMLLFAVGAYVMRAAGCTYNDIVDRDIDARVARTALRPIPSGQVSARAAAAFMLALCLVGLLVLVQFNRFSILLGIASLAIVAAYPFMKRITSWPQAVLGLAFSWGALMGWAAAFGSLDLPALLLFAATVAWVIGYDTIYAHQDREDDALLGLGSTALRFGARTRPWLAGLYGTAWLGIVAAGLTAGAGPVFLVLMSFAAMHLAWQVVTLDIDDPGGCLVRFRANRDVGLIVLAAFLAPGIVGWLAHHLVA
ncbi:MAG: 4-hydroxybenzoate octaprenyltransferase [Rhizobiales bacterium]|nr:4-hydroxybenzoate octaprenyltransferase [Hyphomicrobiales bacterium]